MGDEFINTCKVSIVYLSLGRELLLLTQENVSTLNSFQVSPPQRPF